MHIEDKPIVLEHIISVIHTSLLTISKSSLPRPNLRDPVFELVDEHMRVYGVDAEGINMISAVSSCYKMQFQHRIN